MIEKHVVELETAKKLAKYLPKGFESLYYYNRYRVQSIDGTWAEWSPWILRRRFDCHGNNSYQEAENLPAPILEEVLKLLPKSIVVWGYKYKLSLDLLQYQRKTMSYNVGSFHGNFKKQKENLTATAAAKLYMWLVDEGYIGGEDIE